MQTTNPAWRQDFNTWHGLRDLNPKVGGTGTATPLPMTETQKREARKREKTKKVGF